MSTASRPVRVAVVENPGCHFCDDARAVLAGLVSDGHEIEVTSLEPVSLAALRAEDARRAGASSLLALRRALSAPAEQASRRIYRIGLRYAGPDPRDQLRETIPDVAEVEAILAGLDRLDRASSSGPWTRDTLRLVDDNPGVRAPELAARLGRPREMLLAREADEIAELADVHGTTFPRSRR